MAQKQVDLVFRAKDEAARVVDTITASIEKFNESQSDLVGATGKSGSALAGLGTTLASLDRAFKSGNSGPTRIAAEMDKAAGAISEIEQRIAGATENTAKLTTAQAEAAAATARFTAEAQDAAQTLDREQKALAALTEQQRLSKAAVADNAAETAKQTAASVRLNAQLTEQTGRAEKLQATYDRLLASFAATDEPSAALVTSLLRASDALGQQGTRLESIQAKLAGTAAETQRLGAVSVGLASGLASATAAVDAQKAVLETAGAAATHYGLAVKESVKAEADLARASQRNAATIVSETKSLAAAQAGFAELTQAAQRADAAISQIGEQSTVRLTAALDAQNKKVQDATAALQRLRDVEEQKRQVATLAQTVSAAEPAGAPVQPALTDLQKAQAASTTQAAVLNQQADAFARLQAIAAETGGTLADFADRERRAAGVIADSNVAIRGIQEAGSEAQKGLETASAAAVKFEAATLSSTQKFKESIASQEGTVAATRKALAEAAAAQQVYSQAVAGTRKPSEELNQALAASDGLVAALTQALNGQTEALTRMQAIAGATAHSVEQVALQERGFAEAIRSSQQSAQGVAVAQRDFASASKAAAGSLGEAVPKVYTFADAFRSLYGEGRQSLSFLQRLRGEVLSTAASFGGLYAAYAGIQKTVDAFKTLEQSQNRLAVVFSPGDTKSQSEELDYLRRLADKLGISFQTLADEYTKFAVATKGTNIEGQRTRDIFQAVAEAARVNHLSVEDTNGVFLALTQIVSKGNVQMEELRGQLGDRLPGALQLMAQALGVTTAELDKMVKQGEVTSAALVPFADQLHSVFGPALTQALGGTTAAFGAFSNAGYQAFLRIAQAGAVAKITDLIQALTTKLRSAEGETALNRISAAIGVLADLLTLAVNNVGLLSTALGGFVGIKVAVPLVLAFVGALRQMAAQAAVLPTAVGVAKIALVEMSVAAGTASAALTVLGDVFKFLTSANGISLAVTAIGLGLGYWASQADHATDVLTQHRKIVDDVKNAYDEVHGAVDKWADSLTKVSKLSQGQALVNQRQQLAAYSQSLDDLAKASARIGTGGFLSAATGSQRFGANQLAALMQGLRTGSATIEDFKAKIDDLNKSKIISDDQAKALYELADNAKSAGDRVKEATAVVDVFQNKVTDTTKAALGLGNAGEKAGAQLNDGVVAGTKKFGEALQDVSSEVPRLADSMERLSKIDALDKSYQTAVKLVQTMSQLEALNKQYAEARAAIDNKYGDGNNLPLSGTSQEQSFRLISQREGYKELPYKDSDGRYRAGYGSDQTTLADGTVKAVVAGVRVTQEDSNRDLVRRIDEFQKGIIGSIGEGKFAEFNERQQAALTDLAYNYGHLPEAVANVIRSGGDAKEVAAAIRSLASDNGGVNADRRNQEADIVQAGTLDPVGGLDALKKTNDEAAKRVEKEKEYHEELKGSIADQAFEAQQVKLENDGKGEQAAVNRAIHEAEANAKKENTALTKDELAQLEAVTRENYKAAHATDAQTEALKKAKEASQVAADLSKAQKGLQQEMVLDLKSGNLDAYGAAKDKIASINDELTKAADKAIAMWQAIGGPESVAAIAKLETMKVKGQAASTTLFIDFKRVGDLFADDVVSAFDDFTDAVAQGVPVGQAAAQAFQKFAADFLKQIADMILKQLVLNAVRGIGTAFGGAGGGIGSALASVAHSGGIVGSATRTRSISPEIWNGAARLHTGGVAGLAPDEYAYILQKNEEVLPESDPRNILNGGALPGSGPAAAPVTHVKVVNAIDSGSFVSEGMSTTAGGQAVLNFVKANKGTIKAILA